MYMKQREPNGTTNGRREKTMTFEGKKICFWLKIMHGKHLVEHILLCFVACTPSIPLLLTQTLQFLSRIFYKCRSTARRTIRFVFPLDSSALSIWFVSISSAFCSFSLALGRPTSACLYFSSVVWTNRSLLVELRYVHSHLILVLKCAISTMKQTHTANK